MCGCCTSYFSLLPNQVKVSSITITKTKSSDSYLEPRGKLGIILGLIEDGIASLLVVIHIRRVTLQEIRLKVGLMKEYLMFR